MKKINLAKLERKLKEMINIILGVVFFLVVIGFAFAIGSLFGLVFIIGFAISIYNGDLKKNPSKPIAIFVGGLIARIALNDFLLPVLKSGTTIDLVVSVFIFMFIFLLGIKIKRS
jgi:hypothetical protein